MKENVLDVLIYLFESYMSSAEASLFAAPEELTDELEGAGFKQTEVSKAIDWLIGLRDNQLNYMPIGESIPISFRLYSPDENEKIDNGARAMLNFMQREEVINSQTRELIIDRAMALESSKVEVDELKWIMLFVLCFQKNDSVQVRKLEDVILLEGNQGSIH